MIGPPSNFKFKRDAKGISPSHQNEHALKREHFMSGFAYCNLLIQQEIKIHSSYYQENILISIFTEKIQFIKCKMTLRYEHSDNYKSCSFIPWDKSKVPLILDL